jgi:DNA-binding LytR/AlgR family response regulator
MNLRCLIVDDEPIARSILESYVKKAPMLLCVGSLDNALSVMTFLAEQSVDIIFLDINMPEFSGIDLLKILQNPPAIILTTAYSEYGAESYKFNVIDYLMKPIAFDRFMMAIDKVINKNTIGDSSSKATYLYLKEDYKIHKVNTNDILYVQALGNYCKIYLENKVLITRKTISKINEKCSNLIRIHKSYLVSSKTISSIVGSKIITPMGKELPIGRSYKKQVLLNLMK